MTKSKVTPPYWKDYNMQKTAAKHRGVPFNITYDEWIKWWGADVSKRGRNRPDAMVMALIDPAIGYQLDNIVKRTKAQHSSIYGQPNMNWGKTRPVHTPLGEFQSINKAADAHNMYSMTVRGRCLSKRKEFVDWYFIEKG